LWRFNFLLFKIYKYRHSWGVGGCCWRFGWWWVEDVEDDVGEEECEKLEG
jgi:hypothetical protein